MKHSFWFKLGVFIGFVSELPGALWLTTKELWADFKFCMNLVDKL